MIILEAGRARVGERQRRTPLTKLTTIEGIGEAQSAKLREAGINAVEALLEEGKTPAGRWTLAEETAISETVILGRLNRADLFRIEGIGEEYADLLEEAGVDTVPELAQRNPKNLRATIRELNESKKFVWQLPGQSQVARWIEEAKELPRVIA